MNLPHVILDQLQFDKLGFDGDDSKIIEKAFFVKAPQTIELVSDTLKINNLETKQGTNPWWKF